MLLNIGGESILKYAFTKEVKFQNALSGCMEARFEKVLPIKEEVHDNTFTLVARVTLFFELHEKGFSRLKKTSYFGID